MSTIGNENPVPQSAQEPWKYLPTWPSYDTGHNISGHREVQSSVAQYEQYYGKYSYEHYYEPPSPLKHAVETPAAYPKTSTPVPTQIGMWPPKRTQFHMSTPKQYCSAMYSQPHDPYTMPISPASVESSSIEGSCHNSSSGFFSEDSSLDSYSPAPSPSCFDVSMGDVVPSPAAKRADQEPMAPPNPRPTRPAKPPATYIAMISSAILSTTERKMILADIYDYILEHYPFYRSAEPTWRNAIRHNLSVNECFIKNGRSETGRGYFWSVHPACIQAFLEGDFRRREARRRCQIVNKTCQQMARELAMVGPQYGYQHEHSYMGQSFTSMQAIPHGSNVLTTSQQTLFPVITASGTHLPATPVETMESARETLTPVPDDVSILREAAAMAELYDHVTCRQTFEG